MWNPNILFDGKESLDRIKISIIFTRKRLRLANLGFLSRNTWQRRRSKKALEAYSVLLCRQINQCFTLSSFKDFSWVSSINTSYGNPIHTQTLANMLESNNKELETHKTIQDIPIPSPHIQIPRTVLSTGRKVWAGRQGQNSFPSLSLFRQSRFVFQMYSLLL